MKWEHLVKALVPPSYLSHAGALNSPDPARGFPWWHCHSVPPLALLAFLSSLAFYSTYFLFSIFSNNFAFANQILGRWGLEVWGGRVTGPSPHTVHYTLVSILRQPRTPEPPGEPWHLTLSAYDESSAKCHSLRPPTQSFRDAGWNGTEVKSLGSGLPTQEPCPVFAHHGTVDFTYASAVSNMKWE